ncbi:hypothetical protein [Novosphingobium sp. AAP83]|uniref:hypothetical protein n=1 Tax=Novosphingobium sp. AAP83 TaxID=1523425 RepID=UPI0012FA02BA|nr:hypothetical protein [Novosphingobium sp. AAP83]
MKLIEIRRSSGVLLIGRKGAFPAIMLKANDEQRCASTLRTLAQDRAAIVQLRAQWSNIFATRLPENPEAQDPARLLLREIAAGSIQAILLRTPRIPLTPADVAQITTGTINVGNEQRRLLIANKGTLPPQVLAFNNSQAAIAVLNQLRDSDATARQIDLQAGRLNPGGKVILSGASFRKHLAQQISAGVLEAAVVDQTAAATAIAARPDAETPPGQMGSFERIGSALKRSLPYAIESGDEAIRLAVEEFLQPESIAVMIAMAAAVALANTNPVTGAAVNTTLVLLGWANGGMKAIKGIGAFVMATIDAQSATTEAELDQAAKAYGKALGAMGPDLLNAIVGKFVPKKGGGGSKGGKANVSGTPPQRNQAQTQKTKAEPGKPKDPQSKPIQSAPYKGKLPTGSSKTMTSEEANHFHELKGNRPPYAPGKPVKEIITDSDEAFVRVHGKDNQAGSWVMRKEDIEGLSPQQIKDKFALPDLPTQVSDVSVPAGTKLRVGEAGGLPPWGSGGGMQVEVMERTSVFTNPRPL